MLIEIREATLADERFIIAAQIAMALETEEMNLDLPTVEKGVRAVFSDSRKGQYFVAIRDHQRVGCLLAIPEWSDWRNGIVLWIHSVYVNPQARKAGVFRVLYENLKAMIAGDENLRGLRLYVDKRNKTAQKAYQNLGMSNEHYEMYEWMKTF